VIAEHRKPIVPLISGHGLEIGALHHPFPLPAGAAAEYADAMTREQAAALFPEVDASAMVEVGRIVNLDEEGLAGWEPGSLDFVIISHVLEHLANPLAAIEQVFRILKVGGRAIIAIPDMRFTFDRFREATSFEHLWADYANGVRANSDEHYLDYLRGVAPRVFLEPKENLPGHVAWARSRREHAHTWTSATFRECLLLSFERMKIRASILFESMGDDNKAEYVAVLEKQITRA
jgi:SAM-dependent methyltransferase